MSGGGGGWGGNQFPTFDAESKFAKFPNSHVRLGGMGVETSFQLLMLSPNLLKSKNIFTREFAENLSFRAKKCLGMVVDFEYHNQALIQGLEDFHLQGHIRCYCK